MTVPSDILSTLPAEPLNDVLRRVRSGDILLCSAIDPFSKLIRWATKSPWSHVAIAYRWPSLGPVMVFESVQKLGVRAVPLSKFISQTSSGQTPYPGKILLARHDGYAAAASATEGKRKARLADFAVEHLGDPFAAVEIVRIGLRVMHARTGRKTPRMLIPRDAYICSEYAAKCFDRIGLKIRWDGRGFIAPADFAEDPNVRAVAQIRTR